MVKFAPKKKLITTLDTKFYMFGVCLTWPLIPMICEYRGHLPQFCPLLDRHQTFVKFGLSNVVVCTHVLLATLVSIISKIAIISTRFILLITHIANCYIQKVGQKWPAKL